MDKTKRTSTNLRIPAEMLERVRRIAVDEERPLNTQLIRFIRIGLEQHQMQSGRVRRLA